MRKNIFASLLTALTLASSGLAPLPVLAWNDFGHMTVAYLAYKKLTPTVRARADKLLTLNPAYNAWLAQLPVNLSEAERNTEIFMLASTWPDTIKGDRSYFVDGSQHGFRPEGAGASQNIGYDDHQLHKYWHFVDQPFSYDHSPLPDDIVPNALTQMQSFDSVLASDSADELKSFDLVWVLHMVGDLHQPLHCVTRVSRDHPNGDSGGNDVLISGAGESKNLHGFWDWILGRGGPSDVIAFADKLPEPSSKAAAKLDAKTWADEGYKLAVKKVYVGPIKKGSGPFVLDEAYVSKAKALAEQRAALGGARLGNLLNAELK
ncbi:MAG: S1/P1 nuclease [Cyanobacteria bacterium REEB67]|nr:S1/P1 nuclease [Cyanobacteria bacterium REEB67]